MEADEVTYPLHVILRYDIERALFRGEMNVDEIPTVWVERMKSDLGVEVPDDAQGCLQDIHWSFGAVGYFPSYTLGAIMAVQIFGAAKADLGEDELKKQISSGDFSPLREWLREKIHARGSTPKRRLNRFELTVSWTRIAAQAQDLRNVSFRKHHMDSTRFP